MNQFGNYGLNWPLLTTIRYLGNCFEKTDSANSSSNKLFFCHFLNENNLFCSLIQLIWLTFFRTLRTRTFPVSVHPTHPRLWLIAALNHASRIVSVAIYSKADTIALLITIICNNNANEKIRRRKSQEVCLIVSRRRWKKLHPHREHRS